MLKNVSNYLLNPHFNMSQELYYTAPPEDIFKEMQEKACIVWSKYSNEYGYQTEKTDKVKSLQNISDNFMYILAMFDSDNISELYDIASDNLKREIKIRLDPETLYLY